MPDYSTQDAANLLNAQGLNPQEFDLDGYAKALSAQSKVPQGTLTGAGLTPPQAPQQQYTPLQTAAKVGARSIIPTLSAGAGWAGGGALAAGLGLAPESMGASLLLPVATSIAASYLGNKAQESGLKAIEGPEQYQQGVNELQAAEEQNPKTAFAASLAPQLLLGRPGGGLDLINRLKGATIAGGSDIASQLITQGKGLSDIDFGEAAKSAGAGALFNRPQLLGRLPFFGGSQVNVLDQQQGQPNQDVSTGKVITDPSRLLAPALADYNTPRRVFEQPAPTQPKLLTWPYGVSEAARADLSKMQAEDIKNALLNNQVAVNNPRVAGVNPQLDYTKGVQAANKEVAEAGLPRGEDEQGNPIRFQQQPSLNNLLKDNPQFQQYTQDLANKMGVTVEHVANLKDQAGNDVAGAAYVKDRIAQINPANAGLDTGFHELNHIFWNDAKNSINPTDRYLISEGQRIFGSEEAAVEALGVKDASDLQKQTLRQSKPAGWLDSAVNWIKNFWSNVKFKYGNASTQDITRLLQQRRGKFYEEGEAPRTTGEEGQVKYQQQSNPILNSKVGVNKPISTEDEVRNNPALHGYDELPSEHPSAQSIPGIRSVLDAARAKGEGAAADALQNVFKQFNEFYGKFTGPLRDLFNASPKDRNEVTKILQESYKTGQDLKQYASSPKVASLVDKVRATLLDKQNYQIAHSDIYPIVENGEARAPRIEPFFYPQEIRSNLVNLLTKQPNSPEAMAYKNDWYKHFIAQGETPDSAKKLLDETLSRFTVSNTATPNQTMFGGNRLPVGRKLPDSWLEPDSGRALDNYFKRVAKDFAWRANIENNPQLAKKFGYNNITVKDPTTGAYTQHSLADLPVQKSTSQELKNVFDYFRGAHTSTEQIANAFGRVATSLFLGPATGIHIAVSTPLKLLELARPGEIPGMFKAMGNISTGIEHALTNGVARNNLAAVGSDFLEINNRTADVLSNAANVITKLSGRQHLDLFCKGIAQMGGEHLMSLRVMQARQGDARAQDTLKKLDPSFDWHQPLSQDTISKLGSLVVNYAHGAYDPRNMPAWMLEEGFVAPFFKLASWNIGQTNNFMKHIWSPATEYVSSGGTRGDYKPILMSVAGGILGGALIKAIREKLTDREGPIPTLNELLNSPGGVEGHIPIAAYQAMAAMTYSGFAGILSSFGKAGFDWYYKNKPQGAIFPLDELLSSSVDIGSNYFTAIMRGDGNFKQITAHALRDFFSQNVQMSRIALNWVSDHPEFSTELAQRKKIAVANRNLRAYEEIQGLPYNKQEVDESNPYLEINQKLFKGETDINKAAAEVPELIRDIFNRWGSQGPEVLRNRLEALKINNYRTMPNPATEPLTSIRYLNFVRDTQGTAAANALLQDYFRQNLVNKAKSSLIPSL